MTYMKLRELPDVFRCRTRERNALDGTVTDTAAFFRLVLFGRDFEHRCLHGLMAQADHHYLYPPDHKQEK